jgi:hypothetical protein
VNGLKRVLAAPGLVLALWVAQLLLAWHLATPVRVAARAAIGEYAWIDDGHLMSALIELFADHQPVAALLAENAMVASVLGVLFWGLAYGGVIRRLSGKATVSELAAASVGFLPAIAAQTLWLGIVRAALVAAAFGVGMKLPALAVVLGVAFTAVTIVAADLARVDVVLLGGRKLHPATAWRALKQALTQPRLLAGAGTLAIAQMVVPLLALYLVLSDTGGAASIWLARALTLVALGLGLWRIGVVVEAREG